MNLILMSGNSLRNRDWIYQVEKALKPLFSQTYVNVYDHWAKSQPMADIQLEADKLAKLANSMDREYTIFAKSIGSVITLQDIAEAKIKPAYLVITGLPLNLVDELNLPLEQWLLYTRDIPTLIIQNSKDPVGSFARLSNYVTADHTHTSLNLVEIAGNDTHDYDDLANLKSLVKDFIK